MVGDWKAQMRAPLENALAVSQDVFGRTGMQACRHAVILMAQSARHLAKQSAANRQVMRNQKGPYVDVYAQRSENRVWSVHKWQTSDNGGDMRVTWAQVKRIKNRGLAKRSWMWGLSQIGGSNGSKPLQGAYAVAQSATRDMAMVVKTNKLAYIEKAMPAGWLATVTASAGNKIMAQARDKMQREWVSAVKRGNGALAGLSSNWFFTTAKA